MTDQSTLQSAAATPAAAKPAATKPAATKPAAAKTALAALVLAGAGLFAGLVTAPFAAADTDPLLPYGTNPHSSSSVGQHTSNHDEVDTTNGFIDLPF